MAYNNICYSTKKSGVWIHHWHAACFGSTFGHEHVSDLVMWIPFRPDLFSTEFVTQYVNDLANFFEVSVTTKVADAEEANYFKQNKNDVVMVVHFELPKEKRNKAHFLSIGTGLRYLKERCLPALVYQDIKDTLPADWSFLTKMLFCEAAISQYGHSWMDGRPKFIVHDYEEFCLRIGDGHCVSPVVSGGSVPIDKPKYGDIKKYDFNINETNKWYQDNGFYEPEKTNLSFIEG